MYDKSREHLKCLQESYAAHFLFAAYIALLCFNAGFGILIHALCPAILQTTGSNTIFKMNEIMPARKEKHNALS